MKKYAIKRANVDFGFRKSNYNVKGSRVKFVVIDNKGNMAFFKYERLDYKVSEASSEKIAYEIAKVLGYKCARIELATDNKNVLGVLNYWFDNITGMMEHTDMVSYFNKEEEERSEFYTISNIKRVLDALDVSLFADFLKIMVFDALIGEQDRHEENWGIRIINQHYEISPLYDNGCSLLREFKNEDYAMLFYNKLKDFDALIRKSKTLIYKEDGKSKYKHFELIEYLYENYPNLIYKEIQNLYKLTDQKIMKIVNSIPDELLTNIHKKYIIEYLIKRRNILLQIIN